MSSVKRPVLKSVSPILPVSDIEKSIQYFDAVLGFRLGWKWGTPPSVASVCRDEVEIMLTLRASPGTAAPAKVYVVVQGIDEYYAQAVASGANVFYPLAAREYGMRDCRLIDPDGNELSFGESLS